MCQTHTYSPQKNTYLTHAHSSHARSHAERLDQRAQISPSFATEFKGTLEAVLKVATGQVPETAAAADPPAQAAEPAAAEGEKPVEEAPAADAPDAPAEAAAE